MTRIPSVDPNQKELPAAGGCQTKRCAGEAVFAGSVSGTLPSASSILARTSSGSLTPAAPALGDGWSANYARWEAQSQDGVPLWNVGFLSPGYHLVDMAQTARSNPTWLAQRTQLIPPTDERTVNGITWQIHHRDASGKQDEFTAWVGELKDSTVVLSGQAPSAEFEHVAGAVSGQ